MPKRKALIIGGSLAGLFAANLLRGIGCEVEVFERVTDEMSGRGAGIVTHPELFEALARCGIPVLHEQGHPLSRQSTRGGNQCTATNRRLLRNPPG